MSHVTQLTTYLKLMVTNLTAVKVKIPTIKIIMKVTKKTLSTKPISTSLTLLKIKLMGDGILVPWPWNLHLVVKIEPKTLFVCDRNSQNSWRIPIPSAQLTKTIHQRWNAAKWNISGISKPSAFSCQISMRIPIPSDSDKKYIKDKVQQNETSAEFMKNFIAICFLLSNSDRIPITSASLTKTQ